MHLKLAVCGLATSVPILVDEGVQSGDRRSAAKVMEIRLSGTYFDGAGDDLDAYEDPYVGWDAAWGWQGDVVGVAEHGGDLAELVELALQDVNRMANGRSVRLVNVAEQAANTLIWERDRHPEIADAAVERLIKPRLGWIRDAIDRALQRGEIPAPASLDLMTRIGPAMIIQHLLENGAPPTRHRLTAIVDQVLLPALSG